jgi:galactokinase
MATVTEGPSTVRPLWSPVWTREEGANQARALFTEAFEYTPKAVRSAPGRVTIVGEHTDYSRGVSLVTSTQQATYAAASARSDDVIRVAWRDAHGALQKWQGTLGDAQPSRPGDNRVKTLGIIWALTERGYVVGGVDLAIASCVPDHAGLAEGVSVLAAIALAVQSVWGLALDNDAGRIELAEVCVEAEAGFSGVPTAGMVQHTVLRCPPGEAVLLDFETLPPVLTRQPLYFPEYGLGLLLINTGEPNPLTLAEYSSRWDQVAAASKELGVQYLREIADDPHPLRRVEAIQDPIARRRARHVVTEIERVRIVCA